MEEKVNVRQHTIDDQLPSMHSCNERDDISSICVKSCRTVKATSCLSYDVVSGSDYKAIQ